MKVVIPPWYYKYLYRACYVIQLTARLKWHTSAKKIGLKSPRSRGASAMLEYHKVDREFMALYAKEATYGMNSRAFGDKAEFDCKRGTLSIKADNTPSRTKIYRECNPRGD